MPKRIRIYLIFLYASFFALFSIFLIINSFGYRINTENLSLENSALVNIRTAPFASIIILNKTQQLITPTEFKITTPGTVTIQSNRSGYIQEEFILGYDGTKNANVRIEKWYLLPEKPSEVKDFRQNAVSFLNSSLLLTENNSQYYASQVNTNGVQNTKLLSIKNKELPLKFQSPLQFAPAGRNSYWSQNSQSLILLDNSQPTWYFLPSSQSWIDAIVIDQIIYALTTDGEVYQIFTENNEITFVESDVDGITYSTFPQGFWIRKDGWIKRLTDQNDISVSFTPSNVYIEDTRLNTSEKGLRVVALLQGYAFLAGETLLYHTDIDNAAVNRVDDSVIAFTGANDTLYWMTNNGELKYWNIRTGQKESLTRIELSEEDLVALSFHKQANRILIRKNTTVFTVWHDNDYLNSMIVSYPVTKWIENKICSDEAENGIFLCTEGTDIHYYINRTPLF